jgi:N-acetylglucosaminyldiphosphoundecaprenol N-acetyl-beta-D-mannosaminyltransferase
VLLFVSLSVPLLLFASHGPVKALLLCSGAMLLLGAADDIRTLPRWVKLVFLLVVCWWASRMGIVVEAVKPPFVAILHPLGGLSRPLTVVWLAALTGGLISTRKLPGFTSGLLAIASLSFLAVLAIVGGSAMPVGTAVAAALFGANLAYSRWDFPPAPRPGPSAGVSAEASAKAGEAGPPPRLPLGSSGYYSMSFAFASLTVIGALKNTAFLILLVPLLVFALPLIDNTYAAIYGFQRGDTALALTRRKEPLHQALLHRGLGIRPLLALYLAGVFYCCLVAVLLVALIKISFLVKLVILAFAAAMGLTIFRVAARIVSPAKAGQRVRMFGIPVDALDMKTAVSRIEQFIRERRPHQVVTSDSSAIARAQQDAELREILQTADLVTPDGMGVVWMGRILGLGIGERLSGVDLVGQICALAVERGYSVYLLGAREGVAEEAARTLKKSFPGLRIAGAWHGYFSSEEEPEVIARIKQCKPDILLVAFGIPKQEKWIRRHLEDLAVPVAIGVGGSLDVISGRVKRAPAWVQKAGLEWLYRTAQHPARLPRLAAVARFVWMGLSRRR